MAYNSLLTAQYSRYCQVLVFAYCIVTTFQETDLPPGERQEPRHGNPVRPPQAVRHRRGKSGAGQWSPGH